MLLSLWHYLKGYVIVEVKGINGEKFLNLATFHGIFLWNIRRQDQCIYFCCSIPDFKAMKRDVYKAKVRVKIIAKKGLPFFLSKYRRRKLFMIGMGLFVMMLWLLSSFVWLIEVEGNMRISGIDILHTLEGNGYKCGKLKSTMNLRKAEAALLKAYPDMIWVGIDYEGTRMIVRLSESVLPPEMNDLVGQPTSLISKRDALVTYIAVEKGKPMVKAGDIVKKGDMLVAGEMPLGEENPSPYFTTAKAVIKGKTIYSERKTIRLKQIKKQYLDTISKRYTLKIFDRHFKLFSQNQLVQPYDTLNTLYQLRITKLFPLPFGFEVQNCIGYEPIQYILTKEEAEDKLLSTMWKEMSQSIGEDARILRREAYFSEANDSITGILYVVAEENIGYPIQVTVDMQNKGETQHE